MRLTIPFGRYIVCWTILKGGLYCEVNSMLCGGYIVRWTYLRSTTLCGGLLFDRIYCMVWFVKKWQTSGLLSDR